MPVQVLDQACSQEPTREVPILDQPGHNCADFAFASYKLGQEIWNARLYGEWYLQRPIEF